MASTHKKFASDRGKTGSARQLWEQARKTMNSANRGSFVSRETYLNKLSPLLDHVGQKFKLQKIEKLSDKHILSFIEDAYTAGKSASTVWNTVSAAQYLNSQLSDEQKMKLSDTSRLKEKYIEYQQKSNPAFSKKDTQRHYIGTGKNPVWRDSEIEAATNLAVSQGRYDVALSIQFGLQFGTRLHETHRQDRTAITDALEKGKLTTKGKGGYVRGIQATKQSQQEILRLAKNQTSIDGQKVFVTDEKNVKQSMKSVQNWIYNHREKFAEDGRALTYHGLRATNATREYQQIYQATGNHKAALKGVSEHLGHHRTWITRVYLDKQD